MPPTSGSYDSTALRGLTQITWWARRDSRSIDVPTRAGSSISQPSETMTTTAPRAMPRRPYESRKSASARPMRVPPDQSGAAAAALR